MAFKTKALLAVRPLQQLGSPCLRAVAADVPPEMFGTPKLAQLVADLVETMRDANGAGIAAPQIDEPWRVFVVHGTGANPRYPYKPAIPLTVFVNPVIEVVDATPMHLIEGCLSVPGFRGRVDRFAKVRCRAQRPEDGSYFTVLAEGHASGTLQHEFDHLEATLFPDLSVKQHGHAGGLMTAAAFEAHAKDAFFAYAQELNTKYPTPLVWEPTEAALGAASGKAAPAAKKAEDVCYEADLTWTGGAFERGVTVTVCGASGKIKWVGRNAAVAATAERDGTAKVVRLPGKALVPGFVNAHSHAFQRGLRGRGETYPRDGAAKEVETPSFWSWREAMYGLVTELGSKTAFKDLTLQCFKEMAAAGITTVGEFHYFHHSVPAAGAGRENFDFDEAVVEAAAEANIRLVLLSAFYERGGFDGAALSTGQQRFETKDVGRYWASLDKARARVVGKGGGGGGPSGRSGVVGGDVGVVVHSLRAVGVAALKALAQGAFERGLVLHVHLEEQQKEIDDCLKEHGVTPLALLLSSVPAAQLAKCVAVHATHSTLAELTAFVGTGAQVCVCPLTEASLGDGVFASLAATKGRVSLGSDCNARIDMFEEMRWLEYSQRLARHRRGVFSSVDDTGPNGGSDGRLAAQLMDCATVHGANALGVSSGSIEAGKWADFALVDLAAPSLKGAADENLLGACVFGGSAEGLVLDTCVAGNWTKGLAK